MTFSNWVEATVATALCGGLLFGAYRLVMNGHPWFALLFLVLACGVKVAVK